MKRCTWCNLNNPKYIEYHDHEWGKLNTDEEYLFEMLILESFQAGLSWQCILNKREAFKEAYEDFDIDKVIEFDEEKIEQLRNNTNIIRNKLKIKASISNAKIFKSIQEEYQTFYDYLCTFTHGQIIYETEKTTSALSVSIPWWRSHPIHENRATQSIWTEPCNPLLRATKSTKRATSA